MCPSSKWEWKVNSWKLKTHICFNKEFRFQTLDAHKANAEVGEENEQFTKLNFSSCPKVEIGSSWIHICLEWNISLWYSEQGYMMSR